LGNFVNILTLTYPNLIRLLIPSFSKGLCLLTSQKISPRKILFLGFTKSHNLTILLMHTSAFSLDSTKYGFSPNIRHVTKPILALPNLIYPTLTLPHIRHVIRGFDEGCNPNARFTDVCTETHLKLNPGSFELNASYELFFAELRSKLRYIRSAVPGLIFSGVDDNILKDMPFLDWHLAPISGDDSNLVDIAEQLSEHVQVGFRWKHDCNQIKSNFVFKTEGAA